MSSNRDGQDLVEQVSSQEHSGSNEVEPLLPPPQDHVDETSDTIPAVRNHSYLPGTAHALFPEDLVRRRKRRRRRQQQQQQQHTQSPHLLELPIVELDGVVFFPGSTLPLRLRHPQWMTYLGRKIEASREFHSHDDGNNTTTTTTEEDYDPNGVCLGVLTHVDTVGLRQQRRRSSWMRTPILPGRAQDRVALAAAIVAQDERLQPTVSNNVTMPQQQQQRRLGTTTRSSPVGDEQDPFIGRIGTMAVVSYTFQEMDDTGLSNMPPANLHHQPNGRDQLIVTAFGTGRFRVVSSRNDTHGRPSRMNGGFGDMSQVRLYLVEELPDETLPPPPLSFLRTKCIPDSGDSNDSTYSYGTLDHRHDQVIRHLAAVTPIPYFVYKMVWPWRLMGLIRATLDRIPEFQGMTNNLPQTVLNVDSRHDDTGESPMESSSSSPLLEPLAFSFWMASNMSLNEDEKIEMLNMQCTVQRLRFIYKKLLEQERNGTSLCCKTCVCPLARASTMFTVGGAEGTTGAYVNEYGIVHQTITLREVNESNLWYVGDPETHNSWFPGYSWTITNCRNCYSHLGWKFCRVRSAGSDQCPRDDRPDEFWGMSSGSVTTLPRVSSGRQTDSSVE